MDFTRAEYLQNCSKYFIHNSLLGCTHSVGIHFANILLDCTGSNSIHFTRFSLTLKVNAKFQFQTFGETANL
jgi:hypothetical protein